MIVHPNNFPNLSGYNELPTTDRLLIVLSSKILPILRQLHSRARSQKVWIVLLIPFLYQSLVLNRGKVIMSAPSIHVNIFSTTISLLIIIIRLFPLTPILFLILSKIDTVSCWDVDGIGDD